MSRGSRRRRFSARHHEVAQRERERRRDQEPPEIDREDELGWRHAPDADDRREQRRP